MKTRFFSILKRLFVFVFLPYLAGAQYAEMQSLLQKNQLINAKLLVDSMIFVPMHQNSAEAWYCRGRVYEAIARAADTTLQEQKHQTLSIAALSYIKALQGVDKKPFIDSVKRHTSLKTNVFLHVLSDSLAKNGMLTKAISYLNMVLNLNDTDTSAIEKISKYYLASKNYINAELYLNKLTGKKMPEEWALKSQIHLYRNHLKNYGAAMNICEKALKAYPTHIEYQWMKAEIMVQMKDFAASAKLLDSLSMTNLAYAPHYKMNIGLILLQNDSTALKGIKILSHCFDTLNMNDAGKMLGIYYFDKANKLSETINKMNYLQFEKHGKATLKNSYELYTLSKYYLEKVYFATNNPEIKSILVNIYQNLKEPHKIKRLEKHGS